MWLQKEISLSAKPRGFHLITDEIINALPELHTVQVGVLHIFIKHTSASLTINENADPSVRVDFEAVMNRLIPEDASYYTHVYEGSDDLPAHIKNSLLGSSVSIPISKGQFNIGIWQGVYLCEHRNHADSRNVVITLQGSE